VSLGKVFIPEPIAASGIDLLQGDCEIVAPWREGGELTESQQRALLHEADATIVRLFTISGDDIARSARLKVIGRHGVGVDSVDCDAATARGIPVVFTPNAHANAVAEHAVTLMMALARQVGPAWQAVIAGRFAERTRFAGVELAGKTLGVIGLGRIGSRVAQIAAHGLAMNVCAFDPVIDPQGYDGPARLVDSPQRVLSDSDFVTLHVPLNAHTKNMINEQTLRLIKPGGRLINTSRGGVIDESALVSALESGALAGAALDVYQTEPLPADHPLCTAANTLLTPHISSSTEEALDNMARDSAQGVLDVLSGGTPKHVANPEALQ